LGREVNNALAKYGKVSRRVTQVWEQEMQ
jgi:hypothetical protein